MGCLSIIVVLGNNNNRSKILDHYTSIPSKHIFVKVGKLMNSLLFQSLSAFTSSILDEKVRDRKPKPNTAFLKDSITTRYNLHQISCRRQINTLHHQINICLTKSYDFFLIHAYSDFNVALDHMTHLL